jgi:hypothetical protein
VDALHRCASILHRGQRLLVDIRRLDRIDFFLERQDLRTGLFVSMLERLLSPQSRFRH